MRERILTTTEAGRPSLDRQYEYLVLSVDARDSVPEARQRVREHSEYGRWELERSRLYLGGRRQYWLRRKVTAVRPTV